MRTFVPRWFAANDRRRDKGLTEPEDVIVFRDLRYSPDGEEGLLDIYLPAIPQEKHPVVIHTHGGGFCYGDKNLYRFYCMEIARQGFAVVNFNYRLLPALFPAPLEDLSSVIHFCTTHAREYALDMNNVSAVGDSAGALLTQMYAAALCNPSYRKLLPETFRKNLPAVTFKAVALHSSPFAREKFSSGSMKHLDVWLGKTKAERRKNWQAVQLADYAKGFPPAFITYSVNDRIAVDSPRFAESLRRAGVKCTIAAYGAEDKNVGYVFQLDVRSQLAKDCMARQTAFFKSALRSDQSENY